MNKKHIIFLYLKGTKEHPRFLLTEDGGYFWTGSDWSPHESRAKLYSTAVDAAEDHQKIVIEEYKDSKHIQVFTLPIECHVRSKEGIDVDTLKKWLKKAMQLHTNFGNMENNGPEESLVLSWHRS